MRLVLRHLDEPGIVRDLRQGRLDLAGAVVELTQDGFVLTAGAEAVAVGEVPLSPGRRAFLTSGTTVRVGADLYRAEIDSGAVPVSGGIASLPTVSSILSDVAPNGGMATGPLPGRVAEELFAAERVKPSSAGETPIGWDGPPPQVRPILPENWNSDFANEGEHASATQTMVRLFRGAESTEANAPPDFVSPSERSAHSGAAVAAFLRGAGLPAPQPGGDEHATLERAGALLRTAIDEIDRLTADARVHYEAWDVSPPPALQDPSSLWGPALMGEDGLRTLMARVASLRASEARWHEAQAAAIGAADETGPHAIARTLNAGGKSKLGRSKRCWAAVVVANERDGVPITTKDRLREALGEAAGIPQDKTP
ncbi:MAG: hypothetical protein AAGF49_00320 [Pseudomonadota bacterium]